MSPPNEMHEIVISGVPGDYNLDKWDLEASPGDSVAWTNSTGQVAEIVPDARVFHPSGGDPIQLEPTETKQKRIGGPKGFYVYSVKCGNEYVHHSHPGIIVK